MRIDSNQPSPLLNEAKVPTSDNSAKASLSALSGSNSVSEDRTQLSGIHVQAQVLAAQLSKLPESRHQKVDALRAAVRGGTYKPDPARVAGALFNILIVDRAA